MNDMNDAIQGARDRLRQIKTMHPDEQLTLYGVENFDDMYRCVDVDRYLVSEHAIAECRPDDEEPYTTDWMIETYGGTRLAIDCNFAVQFYAGTPPSLECVVAEGEYVDVKLPPCKTRRDVRRLLSVLGIEGETK